MRMKQFICLILAGLTSFSIAACTAKQPNGQAAAPTAAPLITEAPAAEPLPAEQPTEAPARRKTVHASTVEELLAAIAPDTEIILAGGTYDLGAASESYAGDNPYCAFVRSEFIVDSDRLLLKVEHADGLCIRAEENAACILSAKESETAVDAKSCFGLTFVGITFEAKEEGICITDCTDVRLERCGFLASTAVYANRCENVSLEGAEITGSVLAVFAANCKGFAVLGADIHDCGMALSLSECEDILVSKCRLHDCRNCEEPLPDEEQGDASVWIAIDGRSSIARFEDCELFGNDCTYLFCFENPLRIDLSRVTVHGNKADILFDFDATSDAPGSYTISDCDIHDNSFGSFLRGWLSETKIALLGTSLRGNTIEGLFRGGEITVFGCEFQGNTIRRLFGYAEDPEYEIQLSVHDRDGNALDEDAILAMELKRAD